MLQPITIQPSISHTATVIFLHGLGDSGHGWAPVMRLLSKTFPFIKFILPNAPSKPVTINGGARMPSWYDIRSLAEDEAPEDESGMLETRATVESLIREEQSKGVALDRIVLGGFSQGGVISLFSGLTGTFKVGGIVALSAYLPLRSKFHTLLHHKDTPIFMGHGTADFVVQYQWGKHSADRLKALGCPVSFNTYQNLDHSFNDLELEDLKAFLRGLLESKPKIKETL